MNGSFHITPSDKSLDVLPAVSPVPTRAERRQRKEEESQLKKELQPALFDL